MINTLRAEWIKIRTVRITWVLGIIALTFPLTVTLLNAYFRGDDHQFSALDLYDLVSGTAFVSSLLGGVIAALAITNEFSFGTIRVTFAATPTRARVLLAKGVVSVALVTALQAVVVLTGFFGGGAIARSRGAHIDTATVPAGHAAMVGVIILAALFALFGYALGLLIRNSPAAIAVMIVWPLIAEGLIGALLVAITHNDDINRWLPLRAAFQMAIVEPEIGGPSRLAAGTYFTLFTFGLAGLGMFFVNRRDA